MTGSIAQLQAALRESATPPVAARPDDADQPDAPTWGATAVPVPTGAAALVPARGKPADPRPSHARMRAVDPVAAALAARPGHRRGRRGTGRTAATGVVAVCGATGGAGVSTLCAALGRLWAASGGRVTVLDASGPLPGATPVGEPGLSWPDRPDDAVRTVELLTAVWRLSATATVGGRLAPDPKILAATVGAIRRAASVAADGGAVGAAAVIDLGARHDYVTAVVPGLGADLVVVCCPARPSVLRACAQWLRTRPEPAGWPPVVLAVTGRPACGARPAIAASSDQVAGWVSLTRRGDAAGIRRIEAAANAAARGRKETPQ